MIISVITICKYFILLKIEKSVIFYEQKLLLSNVKILNKILLLHMI